MAHLHLDRRVNTTFVLGILLNLLFVIIETIYGISADSMALLADAGHNLSDVFSLFLAWGANMLAARPPTRKRTYGFGKATILASLASSLILLVALGGICREAVSRFMAPAAVQSSTMIIVAGVGVVINTITALMLYRGQGDDLNRKGAFWHMAADAAVSLGVVLAGVIIRLTGWRLIDPLMSMAIVAVILAGTWSLLRDSFMLAMDFVPRDIDMEKLSEYLLSHEKVLRIHDLHVWPLSTTKTALSVHLVVRAERLDNAFLYGIQEQLHERFGIDHATVQLEKAEDNHCLLFTPKI